MYRENIGSVVILTKNAGSHDSKRDEVTPVGIITERSIVRMIGFSAENKVQNPKPVFQCSTFKQTRT